MSTPSERRKRGPTAKTGGSPTTAEAILAAAVEAIDNFGVDGFRVETVLDRAYASPSSMYHHFGGRDQLVIAAQRVRYSRTVLAEDRANLAMGYQATTSDEFLEYLAGQLRRVVTDPANAVVRRERFAVVATGSTRPDLAASIGGLQDQMFAVIGELFEWAKQREFINAELDIAAYCAWFHGMAVGQLVVAASSVDIERWLTVAIPAALAPLRPVLPPG